MMLTHNIVVTHFDTELEQLNKGKTTRKSLTAQEVPRDQNVLLPLYTMYTILLTSYPDFSSNDTSNQHHAQRYLQSKDSTTAYFIVSGKWLSVR